MSFNRFSLAALAGVSLIFFAPSALLNVGLAAQVSNVVNVVNEIEILFSPEDNCAAKILQVIEQAQESIDVAIYSFTNRILAQGLIKAHLRGVKVRVFMDGENRTQKYSKAEYLIKNGIEVRFEKGTGLMHNKFCVIDGEMVVTGSFNWTIYADLRNDENLAIIKSAEAARVYGNKFEQLWKGQGIDEAIYGNENRLEKIFLH